MKLNTNLFVSRVMNIGHKFPFWIEQVRQRNELDLFSCTTMNRFPRQICLLNCILRLPSTMQIQGCPEKKGSLLFLKYCDLRFMHNIWEVSDSVRHASFSMYFSMFLCKEACISIRNSSHIVRKTCVKIMARGGLFGFTLRYPGGKIL